MGHRHRRQRRSSVTIRHNIGFVVLGVVLLFLGNLLVSFLRQGDWRGALFTLAVGVALGVVSLYPGRKG